MLQRVGTQFFLWPHSISLCGGATVYLFVCGWSLQPSPPMATENYAAGNIPVKASV